MGKPTKATAAEVIRAIKGTAGIKTRIAQKLGVSRPTIDAYLNRWATVRDAYNEEKSGVDDMALSVVINDIVTNKDVSTAKWWLVRKLPDEFGDRTKVDTWESEIIEALRQGQISPADVALLYPDELAHQFFAAAGIMINDSD